VRRNAKQKAQAQPRKHAVAAAVMTKDILDVRDHFEKAAVTLSDKLKGAITPAGVNIIVGGLMAAFTPRSAKAKLSTEDGRQIPLDGDQIRALGGSIFTRAAIPAMISGMFKPAEPTATADTAAPKPPATKKEQIGRWFDEGIRTGATHMLIVTNKEISEDSPIYVRPGENARTKYHAYHARGLTHVTAVYSMREGKEWQLAETHPMHVD
jgi:hypothetical protein